MSSRPFVETRGAAALTGHGCSVPPEPAGLRDGCPQTPGGTQGPSGVTLRHHARLPPGSAAAPRWVPGPTLGHRAGRCRPRLFAWVPGPLWGGAICPGSTTVARARPGRPGRVRVPRIPIWLPRLCCLRQLFRRRPGARSRCAAAVRGDTPQSHVRGGLAASPSTEVGSRPRCGMGPVPGTEAAVPGGDSLVSFRGRAEASCSRPAALQHLDPPVPSKPGPPIPPRGVRPAQVRRWPAAVQRSLRGGHRTQWPAR